MDIHGFPSFPGRKTFASRRKIRVRKFFRSRRALMDVASKRFEKGPERKVIVDLIITTDYFINMIYLGDPRRAVGPSVCRAD